MLSPWPSTEPFARDLPRLSGEELRQCAHIYREYGRAYPVLGSLLYAMAEALDYIAFLHDEKESQK